MPEVIENKLGTMPIGRLLFVMSVPMMISFLIQALYNVVDSIFVAQISEAALTAVSLAYPMQNVISAIGVGTGVGLMAQLPKALGQGKLQRVEKYANVCVLLCLIYWALFILFGLLLVRPFYLMQVQETETEIIENGVRYLSLVCIVSVGAFYGQVLEKLLTATGNALPSMLSQATGAVVNLLLDPLLIFGFGPFPAMGVTGAAAATVTGQVVAACVAFLFNWKRNKAVRFRPKQMAPTLPILRDIYSVAIPSMITVGLISVMTFCVNQILLVFSTTATAVFGIWSKLQGFAYMAVYGLNNGTVPMLSYNDGAGKPERVRGIIRLALMVGGTIMVFLLVLFELLPVPLLRLFDASDHMMAMGVTALRITCLSLPFGGLCVIFSSAYQALGRSRYTLIINLCRQILVVLPIAWILAKIGGLTWVWWAVPVSEGLCFLLALLLFPHFKRDIGL